MKLRNGVLWVLIVLITITLAACSGNNAGSNQKSSETDNNSSAVKGSANGNTDGDQQSKDKKTVYFWARPVSNEAWYLDNVSKFNEQHPGIEVEVSFIPEDAMAEKLKAAQAAGIAPDVVMVNYSKIPERVRLGQLASLDNSITDEQWNDLEANVLEMVTVNGQRYAYPMEIEASAALYYRKDFFIEAGLDPAKPPKTWNELIEYARVLKTKDRFGIAMPANGGDLPWTSWGWHAMLGVSPISPDWSKASINTPEFERLIGLWKTLFEEELMSPQPLAGYWDPTPLATGLAGMQINGQWAIGEIAKTYPDIADEIVVVPVPTPDGETGVPTATAGGWTLAIDAMSQHKEEAGKFISWLLAGDPQIMADYSNDILKAPVRKSVAQLDLKYLEDSNNQVFLTDILPYATSEPWFDYEIQIAYATAVERVTLEKVSISKALADAEATINDIIARKELAGKNPKQ